MENLVNKLFNNLSNKSILITGVSGFKGIWLAQILCEIFNANVIGLDKTNIKSNPNSKEIINKKNFIFHKINLLNYSALKLIFQKYEFDYIFHFAADSLITYCQKNPYKSIKNNFISTLNLLDLSSKFFSGISLNITTTDKVYLNKDENLKFKENDQIWGRESYSVSKASKELLIHNYSDIYRNKKKFNLNILRAGNVIGGGDFNKTRLFPDIYYSQLKNEELNIRNARASRPWQHILDCLTSYLLIATDNLNDSFTFEKYNIGPEDKNNITVSKILDLAKLYFPNLIINQKENKFYENKTLSLNINKFKKRFEFSPKYDQSRSIEKTFDWYKTHLSKNKSITLNQIKSYYE